MKTEEEIEKYDRNMWLVIIAQLTFLAALVLCALVYLVIDTMGAW